MNIGFKFIIKINRYVLIKKILFSIFMDSVVERPRGGFMGTKPTYHIEIDTMGSYRYYYTVIPII